MASNTLEAAEVEAKIATETPAPSADPISSVSGVGITAPSDGIEGLDSAETDFFTDADASLNEPSASRQDPNLTARQQETVNKLAERLSQILERNQERPPQDQTTGVAQFVELVNHRAMLESGGNTLRAAELLSGIGRYMNSPEGRSELAKLQSDGTPTEADLIRQLEYIATAPEILSPAKQILLSELREAYAEIADKSDSTVVLRTLYGLRAEQEGHGPVHEGQLLVNWDRFNASAEGRTQLELVLNIENEAERVEAMLKYVAQSPEQFSPQTEKIRETLMNLLAPTRARGLSEDQQAKVLFGVRAVMEVGGDEASALGLALRGETDLGRYVALAGSEAASEKAIDLLTGWRDYINSAAGQARQREHEQIPAHDVLERAEKGVRFIASVPAI